MAEKKINPHDAALNIPEANEQQMTVEEMVLRQKLMMSGVKDIEGAARQIESKGEEGAKAVKAPVQETAPKPEISSMSPDLAAAMSAMQKEISDLRTQLQSVKTSGGADDVVKEGGAGGYPWQYYKRSEGRYPKGDPRSVMDGWVVYAPGGATPSGARDVGSVAHYMLKGFKVLTRYGPCPVPVHINIPGASFRPMLERGGAVEFPISQVIAYRWHVDPPIAGLAFPDYERNKDKVNHFLCDECDFEVYFMKDDRDTARACTRHLMRKGQDGSHGYPRREAVLALKAQGIKPPSGAYTEAAAEQDLKEIVKGLDRAPETD